MRRNLTIVAALIALPLAVGACNRDTTSSLGPVPTATSPPPATSPASPATGSTGVTVSPSGSLPPTSSPGITGAVNAGTASATVTGGMVTTIAFGSLGSPAIWEPPPGGMALVWTGPSGQSLGIGGESFTSVQSTSGTRALTLTLRVEGKKAEFRSIAGECQITIDPALPNAMGGSYRCTALASTNGALSINALGTFSATG